MLVSSSLLSFLVIPFVLVSAQVRPTTPGPNETYTAGSTCKIAWDVDPSRSWKNLTIDLMSGPNNNMSRVVNVAIELDGTDASLSPFSWTCPEVTPYSSIYFYQFSNVFGNGTSGTAWTTRFTIASTAGEIEPPANATQPNGDFIPWGVGYLKATSPSSLPAPSEAEELNSSVSGKGSEFETTTLLTPPLPTLSDSNAQRPMIADDIRRKHAATAGGAIASDGPNSRSESTRSKSQKEKHMKTIKVAEEETQAARASAVLENSQGDGGSGSHGQAVTTPASPCNSSENGARVIGLGTAVMLFLTSIVTAFVLMTA